MYLGQRIPVWSLDTKENKYSWPWNITLVLWFLIHSKGQMSRFPQASSKTIIMIKNDKMTRKMIPAKQDTEDDFCVTLVLGGTTIGSWHQADITILLKVAPIPTLSNLWDTLSLDRRRTTGDTRWRFSFSLFSLVWFVPPKKRKLSKVSQRYQGSSALGGGLGCVCVCVYTFWFCYVDP